MGGRPVGVSIGSLSKFFPQHEVEAILRASGREGERRRKLPALDLVYYVIALGLHASEGCRSVLRRVLLRRRARDGEEIERLCSDSAITQGRTRLGWQPLRALYEVVVRPIATRASIGAWFRRWRVVTLDGSTLDVADTKQNERAFGRPGSARGKAGFPQLRFVTLLENGTHVLFGAELGRYNTGEVTLAKKVVGRLPADALCLADRNFFSYPLWKTALVSGAALLWRARSDLILPKLKCLSDGSYLTKIYPSPRACSRCRRHLGTLDYVSPREGTGRVSTALLDPRPAEGAGHSTGEPLHQTVDYRDRFGETEDSSPWRTGRPSKSHPESRSTGFLEPAPGPFRSSSPHARSSTRTEDRSHRSLIRSRSTDRRSIPTIVCLFFSLGRARSSSDHSCVSSPKSESAIDLIAILLVPSNAR